ncbi:transposase [Paraburkholderia sp. CNPSo 3274]|uniref:transposase n=1 Tax=Paraburkholderia sp. CNPSo 3274 TaxID=2940932 RepID=UPI0020B7930A|nr:transposase [Paraburkholderia sp. CNPSo 3274]MCP3706797.1 transposase [Paraburkholderia sp. CNPSo 3274]
MAEKNSELKVVRQSRDGRRQYDEKGKRALIEAALCSGMSVARLAQEHGVNANLLRKWITKYLLDREKNTAQTPQDTIAREHELSPPASEVIDSVPDGRLDLTKPTVQTPALSPFVPVVAVPSALPIPPAVPVMVLTLHVRLSNGVEFDIGDASVEELTTVVQMLGRMPCSASTKT